MNHFLKLGLAYLLAPALVAAIVWLAAAVLGLTLAVSGIGLAVVAVAMLLAALARPVLSAGRRWVQPHSSSVRRRHPRPSAWHQWR
jgi:hypothetical protein